MLWPFSKDKLPLVILTIAVMVCFCLLTGHYYYIMIVQSARWQEKAQRQYSKTIVQIPKRGIFYSNTSILTTHPNEDVPLVVDVERFRLHADPLAIPEELRSQVVQHLVDYLQLSKEQQEQLLVDLSRKTHFRRLLTPLSRAQRSKVLAWWNAFAKRQQLPANALFFTVEYQRSYPFGKLLGQVLHTLADYRDEKTLEALPTGGLELHFNALLKGKIGKKPCLQSPRHLLEVVQAPNEQPLEGVDFHLTINHYLQAVAEEELAKGVKEAQAAGGWVVMMDPFTGHILALAQYPFFYPEQYRLYFNDKTRVEETKVKAICDANEIGSLMKPFTLAICLQANKLLKAAGKPSFFEPEEKIATLDGRFPGRKKPITDVHPKRFVNMDMGLQKSSNVYMARLVERMLRVVPQEWYRQQIVKLGFGEKTGIELPAESAGMVPTIGKMHPNGALEWSKATPYSLAMGYNILASSLQMVRAYAVLANGGWLVQPTLVRRAERRNEVLIDHTTAVQKVGPILDPDVIQRVLQAMKYVTKYGGTAASANLWGYTEAGKTATTEKIVKGQYSKNNNLATFVGIAPLSHPRFVLLVAIDEPAPIYIPGKGKNSQAGTCAAPIFQKIGTRALEYLGEPFDDPYGFPSSDKRFDSQRADWYKESRVLRELFNEWNQ